MREFNNPLVARALTLLREYHEGQRRAYLTHTERSEQDVEPWELSEADITLARMLLTAPAEPNAMHQALMAVGPAEAVRILEQALVAPRAIRYGHWAVFPRISRRNKNVEWTFERMVLGETGIRLDVTVWQAQDVDLATGARLLSEYRMQIEDQWAQWWSGFSRVYDNLGTEYKRGGWSAGPEQPLMLYIDEDVFDLPAQELPSRVAVEASQHYSMYWTPGPPDDVSMLYVEGNLECEVTRLLPEPPWTQPEHVSFGHLRCGIGWGETSTRFAGHMHIPDP